MSGTNGIYKLSELAWDTAFFGYKCAKAILFDVLEQVHWDTLCAGFPDYAFVVLENRDSRIENAINIGKRTQAYLADINIQLAKKVVTNLLREGTAGEFPLAPRIFPAMEPDERLLRLAQFPFSRFLEDPVLALHGGGQVYRHWISNAFGRADKTFIVSYDVAGTPDGFLLCSDADRVGTIELIAVDGSSRHQGVGTRLLSTFDSFAVRQGWEETVVGTQVRNAAAINFYHRNGYRQTACHQIYHLWRS